jgi:anti-sigma factor RsiW
MSEQNRVRASDAERERVVSVLRNAISEGRLTLQEGEERMAAAYATVYRDELPGLTADLPPADPPPAPRRAERARGRRGQPVVGLVALAAVVAGIWALAGGLAVWPAIVLGILAVMLAKRGGPGWSCHGAPRQQWSRPEQWSRRDQASA